jgi:hypothetical protein
MFALIPVLVMRALSHEIPLPVGYDSRLLTWGETLVRQKLGPRVSILCCPGGAAPTELSAEFSQRGLCQRLLGGIFQVGAARPSELRRDGAVMAGGRAGRGEGHHLSLSPHGVPQQGCCCGKPKGDRAVLASLFGPHPRHCALSCVVFGGPCAADKASRLPVLFSFLFQFWTVALNAHCPHIV